MWGLGTVNKSDVETKEKLSHLPNDFSTFLPVREKKNEFVTTLK